MMMGKRTTACAAMSSVQHGVFPGTGRNSPRRRKVRNPRLLNALPILLRIAMQWWDAKRARLSARCLEFAHDRLAKLVERAETADQIAQQCLRVSGVTPALLHPFQAQSLLRDAQPA